MFCNRVNDKYFLQTKKLYVELFSTAYFISSCIKKLFDITIKDKYRKNTLAKEQLICNLACHLAKFKNVITNTSTKEERNYSLQG